VAKSPTPIQRAICLILTLFVTLLLSPGLASAQQQPDITPPDPNSGAGPLNPSSGFSVALNAEITAFKARVDGWQQQGTALATQAQSLQARIAAHNAVVNAVPGRTAPPAVAGSLNARAAALNAERDALLTQISAWKSQMGALEAERLRLLQEMAYVLQNQYKVRPSLPFGKPTGGDPGRNNLGKYTSQNGGDAKSTKKEQAALDTYASRRNVTVEKRQVHATLTREAVAKLTPEEAAQLNLYRKYDGLVLKPNGHYKALEVKTGSARYQPGQKPFDDAILRGGQATAVRDGKTVIIDEVEIIPG
jgi:hypothetical protein